MKTATSWLIQPITLAIMLVALIALTYEVSAKDAAVSYDGSQLWRIHHIPETARSRKEFALPEIMEKKFDVNIWRDGSDYLDISIDRQHLDAAKSYLKQHNLVPEVLNSNIQKLFDTESHRIKRAAAVRMNWKDYQDLPTIYDFLREMRDKFPQICTLINIGKTAEGRDLLVLRISENPSSYKKIWIDGGIHAREWVSPATVTFIINSLLSNWQKQPAYIRQKTWLIMPVVNPDGYEYSRKVNRLWRKNRAPNRGSDCIGVDVNRNFDIAWSATGSSTNPCSDVYRGPTPASELETQAVARFLREQNDNLEAYLTYHSYSQAIVFPWAYKAERTTNSVELQRVGNLASQRIKAKTGKIYKCDVTHRVFGIAGGGSDDWTRATLGTKYVYTVEMRDRGEYGFALPPNQILDAGAEGYTIATTVAEAI